MPRAYGTHGRFMGAPLGVVWLNYSTPSPITGQNLNLSSPRRFLTQERSSSMPSFLIVSDTEDFRVLLAQLLAIEWPDVQVEDWEFPSEDKTPTPWPRVDLVLLDCGASHSEGLEWLRGAPASPERPPIIALTDPEDSEAAAQAVALGAAACLSRRDVSRVRLTAAINAVLQRQIAGEAAVDSEKTLLLSELGVEHLPSATVADPPGCGDHARIKIAGYQVIRELAKGGMSIIFLANHLRAGTTVALKVLDEKLLEDEQFITLFIREYGLIASIQSRYVVKIYDQGFTDLNAYIVMEYFCHGALKDRLKSRAFARHEAMAVFYEILMSLRDIHAHGIVHHDLKPQNIMFRSDGGLALIDFGISKRLDTDPKQAVLGTETILGTPHYMSPDQCEGRQGDHRSDLYSTGAILYEMLTGAKPFNARTAAALLSQHLSAPIPRLPPQLSAYQALVDRLLAKRPEDRYQSASKVLEAVDRDFVPHTT